MHEHPPAEALNSRVDERPDHAAELGLAEPGADPSTPVIIQSFNAASLEILRHDHETRLPLALLVGGEEAASEWLSEEGLARAAEFVSGIGPAKNLIMADPSVVARAHALDLTVVPWTFRARSPGEGFTSVEAEMLLVRGDLEHAVGRGVDDG